MMLGVGYQRLSAESSGEKISIEGNGPGLRLALGGAVRENFILFGELTVISAVEPDFEGTGISTTALTGTSTDFVGVGGGVAYYIMPANVLLSGSLLFSGVQLSETEGDDSIELTEMGPGLNLTVGKEWWVSNEWGLGVAAQLLLARLPSSTQLFAPEARPTWQANALTIAFSATYN